MNEITVEEEMFVLSDLHSAKFSWYPFIAVHALYQISKSSIYARVTFCENPAQIEIAYIECINI
jgi:hypothetical protein